MDIVGIEAFLAIVQTKNLTKAAELLHLSQSAISYRLQTLEKDMGAKLIERRKGIHTISLTPFGESFAAVAERWRLVNRELEVLRAKGPQTSLSIGAADSLNVYVLPPLYRMIRKQYSSMRLQIVTQHTDESYKSLERREVDMAFVKAEKVMPNMIVEPFYVDEMVLVRLASEEGEGLPETMSPAELDSHDQIYFNWGPSYQLWHERWWDMDSPAFVQVDAAALIFSLMQDYRQWAIVPKSIANSFVQGNIYSIQRLSDPPPPRVSYKLIPKHLDAAKQEAVNAVTEMIKLLFR